MNGVGDNDGAQQSPVMTAEFSREASAIIRQDINSQGAGWSRDKYTYFDATYISKPKTKHDTAQERVDEFTHAEASKFNVTGIPVSMEHKFQKQTKDGKPRHVVIGKILGQYKTPEGDYNCVGRIDNQTQMGKLAKHWIANGYFRDVSLSHRTPLFMDDKTGQEYIETSASNESGQPSVYRFAKEMSVCMLGARKDSHIHAALAALPTPLVSQESIERARQKVASASAAQKSFASQNPSYITERSSKSSTVRPLFYWTSFDTEMSGAGGNDAMTGVSAPGGQQQPPQDDTRDRVQGIPLGKPAAPTPTGATNNAAPQQPGQNPQQVTIDQLNEEQLLELAVNQAERLKQGEAAIAELKKQKDAELQKQNLHMQGVMKTLMESLGSDVLLGAESQKANLAKVAAEMDHAKAVAAENPQFMPTINNTVEIATEMSMIAKAAREENNSLKQQLADLKREQRKRKLGERHALLSTGLELGGGVAAPAAADPSALTTEMSAKKAKTSASSSAASPQEPQFSWAPKFGLMTEMSAGAGAGVIPQQNQQQSHVTPSDHQQQTPQHQQQQQKEEQFDWRNMGTISNLSNIVGAIDTQASAGMGNTNALVRQLGRRMITNDGVQRPDMQMQRFNPDQHKLMMAEITSGLYDEGFVTRMNKNAH